MYKSSLFFDSGIDDIVAKVIAVISGTPIVIGLSNNYVTHMRSDDDGFTWYAITNEELVLLKLEPGYETSVVYPYRETFGVTCESEFASYGLTSTNLAITGNTL